ncbi:MAG: hypothetical protein WD055_01045 [Candidatus Dependentiae bacterium]
MRITNTLTLSVYLASSMLICAAANNNDHPFVKRYKKLQMDTRYKEYSFLEIAALKDDLEALRYFIKAGYDGENLKLAREILEKNNATSQNTIDHLKHKKNKLNRFWRKKDNSIKTEIERLEKEREQRNEIIQLITNKKNN